MNSQENSPKVTSEALLQQWNVLQFAIQRVSSASATNVSQRIQTMECERSVFDELLRAYVIESLGKFPPK